MIVIKVIIVIIVTRTGGTKQEAKSNKQINDSKSKIEKKGYWYYLQRDITSPEIT